MSMKTHEFQQLYWKYYLNLENDFLATEKYVAIDADNKDAFSIEYMKILQMVCAEVDVVTKSFCKEIDASFKEDKINHYCKKITTKYTDFPKDSVRFLLCKIDLNPWAGWTFVDKVTKNGNNKVDSQNPLWWKDHNEIKHDRTSFKDGKQNYKKANQNNIINALAALFQMEMYFYNRLADNENLKEKTPLPKSRLFSIPRWTDTVIDGNEITLTVQGTTMDIKTK